MASNKENYFLNMDKIKRDIESITLYLFNQFFISFLRPCGNNETYLRHQCCRAHKYACFLVSLVFMFMVKGLDPACELTLRPTLAVAVIGSRCCAMADWCSDHNSL